jgi:Tn3 transposase DDE domain-containing protein
MLTRWMEQCDRRGEVKKSQYIKQLSPVAWTHVNFQGRYEFLSTDEEINMDTWLDTISINETDFEKKK